MSRTLYYLFDPLCGWCYGVTLAISSFPHLVETGEGLVKLLPTGLFAGTGAKQMDDRFAAYAWSNDQRIARQTGQFFSERYRELVLSDRQQRFDSGPATMALTAVSLTDPQRELDALKGIQRARYVEGANVTAPDTLAAVLQSLGLNEAAKIIQYPAQALLTANNTRINRAQSLMQEFGADGVPTFIAESGTKRWLVDADQVVSKPRAILTQLMVG